MKYEYDKNYFTNIDTNDKAYWLGFLYADGCVSEYKKPNGKIHCMVLDIGLSDKDKQHLVKFNNSLKSNIEIKHKTVSGCGTSRLTVCCTNMCRDLISHGCTPQKSLILEFPSLNDKLLPHFIRGYFDGDGCIYLGKYKYVINFVGTKNFLTDLRNVLKEHNISGPLKIYSKGNAYQMYIYGYNNLKEFYNYVYNDTDLYLDRKYEKFINCFQNKNAELG